MLGLLGTTLLGIGTSSSSIIQIKAIQNQVVDVAANLDFSDITHFCCSLFGQKIENMNGATSYAFSALAYIINNEQFFPRLAHNIIGH